MLLDWLAQANTLDFGGSFYLFAITNNATVSVSL